MNREYITVKTTPGRIEKGILSIPVSLVDIFPKKRQTIFILFDESNRIFEKSFSPYESSTRECRINGIGHWFRKHQAEGGESVVITVVDEANFVYRLCFEGDYRLRILKLEDRFFSVKSEDAANNLLRKMANWLNEEPNVIALNQFRNLSEVSEELLRKKFEGLESRGKEKTPYSLRILLYSIYSGHCQVCNFTFKKRDGFNYFEIHHIRPFISHTPKNLLSVCPNCHRRFEYSEVEHWFNPENWLIKVRFNDNFFHIRQALLNK